MLNNKIYENLLVQFDKVFKHNRQGGYKPSSDMASLSDTYRTSTEE